MPKSESKPEDNTQAESRPPVGNAPPNSSTAKKSEPKLEEKPPAGERKWTRGSDSEAANQALLEANRGTTGGEFNTVLPKSTPQEKS